MRTRLSRHPAFDSEVPVHIPGEYYIGFSVLGMGILSYYAGSHDQSGWDELCFFEYDRQPWRRLLAKYGGAVCIAFGVAIFAGFVSF